MELSPEALTGLGVLIITLSNAITKGLEAGFSFAKRKVRKEPKPPNGVDAQDSREAIVNELKELVDMTRVTQDKMSDLMTTHNNQCALHHHETKERLAKVDSVMERHDERAHDFIVRLDASITKISEAVTILAAIQQRQDGKA